MATNRTQARNKRALRTRRKLRGTGRPRLTVFRSNTNTYAQIIDDEQGRTLAAASTRESGVAGDSKVDKARQIGTMIAERAKEAGVEEVVFDRSGNRYTGRVAAVADGARDAGLKL